MKFIINEIEISEQDFSALVSIKGKLSDRDTMTDWDFTRHVEKKVAERLVERYLAENADKILANVNVQHVVNALVIRSADGLKS